MREGSWRFCGRRRGKPSNKFEATPHEVHLRGLDAPLFTVLVKIKALYWVKATDRLRLEDTALRRTLLILICVFALPLVALGDELPVLKTQVRTLAVFKNGLGFAFRSGSAAPVDGWVEINETPPAVLGTLWIGTTNPLEPVEEVVSYKGPSDKVAYAQSIAELLELNEGKSVVLTYSAGGMREPTTINGKIVSAAGQMVLIETSAQGTVAIKKDSVQSVQMMGDGVLKSKTAPTVNRAKARIGGKPKSAEITLAYLEKGITWSPSYLVNIQNEKTADITLEAVLANDVEDLQDTDVSFVVGYPNFMFSDITNPMSLQQSVSSFVQALASGRSSNESGGYGRAMTQSVAYNYAAYGGMSAGDSTWQPDLSYSATKPMAGESNEDLYLYHQPHVTLKKGDRARYTVFTGKAPYEHVYELDVPDSMNVDYLGNRTGDHDAQSDETQVWHVLRLENTTEHPWTTAPALAVNGSMPVAQDTLKYTPPKGKNTLKLTVATDIRATQEQTEASRVQTTIVHRDYDVVTVNGKLTIRGYKPKPVKLSVTKSMVGEVLEASEGGKAVKVVKKLNSVNPDSQVSWEFELAPGVEKVLTYQYKVLIYR